MIGAAVARTRPRMLEGFILVEAGVEVWYSK